jgi:hypothetical protein
MSETEKKLKAGDVGLGDVMASVEFFKVNNKIVYSETITVTDLDTGLEFEIHGNKLIGQCFSADRFFEEKKVTRTEMAETLSKSFNIPFTVVFQKSGKGKGETKGEMRTLRGRLVSVEALMGRARVIDLDLPNDGNPTSRQRLVDFRTLESLIVGGVKYTLKK